MTCSYFRRQFSPPHFSSNLRSDVPPLSLSNGFRPSSSQPHDFLPPCPLPHRLSVTCSGSAAVPPPCVSDCSQKFPSCGRVTIGVLTRRLYPPCSFDFPYLFLLVRFLSSPELVPFFFLHLFSNLPRGNFHDIRPTSFHLASAPRKDFCLLENRF